MQMWPDLIQKAKDGGVDVIETYVFWNGHEPSQGKVINDIYFYDDVFSIFIFHIILFFSCYSQFMLIFFFFQYYFEDRFDLVKFIKVVQQAGLYVHLRIGPYVCAEWNFG